MPHPLGISQIQIDFDPPRYLVGLPLEHILMARPDIDSRCGGPPAWLLTAVFDARLEAAPPPGLLDCIQGGLFGLLQAMGLPMGDCAPADFFGRDDAWRVTNLPRDKSMLRIEFSPEAVAMIEALSNHQALVMAGASPPARMS